MGKPIHSQGDTEKWVNHKSDFSDGQKLQPDRMIAENCRRGDEFKKEGELSKKKITRK